MIENDRNIRLMVCEDHAIVRSGLIKLMEDVNWICLVCEAEDGEDMIKKYEIYLPDLILADIAMPILSGIDALKLLITDYPSIKVLFLSMYSDDQYIYSAIKAGAMGYLTKNISKDELLHALKEVSLGRKYFGPLYNDKNIAALLNKYDGTKNTNPNLIGTKMTYREEKILTFVGQGLMSSEIAQKMNLGKRSVDKIRGEIMQKFELKTLPAFIRFATNYAEGKKNSNVTIDF